MRYKEEIIKAMSILAENSKVLFVGQNVAYPGSIIYPTLEHIPKEKKLEFPVAEEMQLGFCIGLALSGDYLPVCIYPRFDFLLLAANQLVNHLDKIEEMSHGQFKPKVIIRTCIGSKKPLNPGPQHCQDHTEALKALLTNVEVVKLTEAEEILPAYKQALGSERSSIIIELSEK